MVIDLRHPRPRRRPPNPRPRRRGPPARFRRVPHRGAPRALDDPRKGEYLHIHGEAGKSARGADKAARILRSVENAFSPLLLLLITLILAITIVARLFGVASLRASNDYIRHLVLWIAFAGAMITTREKNHLSLSVGVERIPERIRRWVTGRHLLRFGGNLLGAGGERPLVHPHGFAPNAQVGRGSHGLPPSSCPWDMLS